MFIFSKCNQGCALARRDCESVKQYFLFFLFFFFFYLCFVTEDKIQQKLCVCVPLLKKRFELISTLFAAVKVHRGKETQQLHVKCQSRMIHAVTVNQNPFFCFSVVLECFTVLKVQCQQYHTINNTLRRKNVGNNEEDK